MNVRMVSAVAVGLAILCSPVAAEEYRVVREFRIADEPACMPALTRAPNGDLLVALSTEWEPFPWGGELKLVVSSDGALTWSKPRLLWKDPDPRVTIQVANGMQTLSNGEILLPVTFGLVPKRKGVEPGEESPHKIYDVTLPGYRREVRFLRSNDSGNSWRFEDPKLHRPWWRFGRLVEVSDGRLIMPGRGWYVESRDFGRTWGPRRSLGSNRLRSETNIIEAADGTFLSIVRGGGEPPRRMFGTNFSDDKGRTWGPARSAGVQGKMPDLLVLPSGRVLLAVGAEGLTDGSLVFRRKDRYSFCTLFVSDDHGRSWRRDVAFSSVQPQGSVVPSDSPVLCPLEGGRILVVMQASDRDKADHPLMGFSAGMSIIGNIIEPRE